MGRADDNTDLHAGADGAGDPAPGSPSEGPGPVPPPLRGRVLTVLLAVSTGVAVVGFVIGTRPAESPGGKPARLGTAGAEPAARSYQALRRERLKRPRARELRALAGGDARAIPGKPTPAEHRAALAARAKLRAFAGAPPVVPHGVDARSSAACLSCHDEGVKVKGKRALPLPHPPYAGCTQCHVAAHTPGPEPAWQVANEFVGAKSAGQGTRAWEGAPPTVPHRIWMRGRCLGCHGPGGRPGLRTSHPQRASCLQCHAPSTRRSPVGLPR